jgi:hypothetical protein
LLPLNRHCSIATAQLLPLNRCRSNTNTDIPTRHTFAHADAISPDASRRLQDKAIALFVCCALCLLSPPKQVGKPPRGQEQQGRRCLVPALLGAGGGGHRVLQPLCLASHCAAPDKRHTPYVMPPPPVIQPLARCCKLLCFAMSNKDRRHY